MFIFRCCRNCRFHLKAPIRSGATAYPRTTGTVYEEVRKFSIQMLCLLPFRCMHQLRLIPYCSVVVNGWLYECAENALRDIIHWGSFHDPIKLRSAPDYFVFTCCLLDKLHVLAHSLCKWSYSRDKPFSSSLMRFSEAFTCALLFFVSEKDSRRFQSVSVDWLSLSNWRDW